MRPRLALLALTLAVATSAAPGQPSGAAIQAGGGQIMLPRPDADAGPTRVSIGLYIIDISKINDVDQSMTADFACVVSWRDPRLAYDGEEMRVFPVSGVWSPGLTVINKRRIWTTWTETVTVDPEGNVRYRQRFYGTLTARLDLRDFPFDDNTVKVEFIASGHTVDELELVVDESITGQVPEFSLVDAEIGPGTVSTGGFYFAPSGVTMPRLVYEFEVERYTAYYLWKIILPLTIIVMMSWLVFWIDPKQFGPQVGLAATAVLTLIAYRFLLGSLIPRVSYLTRLDLFIMGATVLVFLGMVEAVASAKIAEKNERVAKRLSRVSRVAFPCAFLVVCYLSFFA